MKIHLIMCLSAFVWFAGEVSSWAQEADFNPLGREVPIERMGKQLRIQVEWIELSHKDYTALMAEKDADKPVGLSRAMMGPCVRNWKK